MAATATIRTLRNDFTRVRRLVEQEGEVVVTEHGTPRYRLTRYTPKSSKSAAPKDYVARLRRHQPRPLSAVAARALEDANRGER
jgi:antitoxin (DNA-binding transcriptional repressor) of toxin-antitoxin stability system